MLTITQLVAWQSIATTTPVFKLLVHGGLELKQSLTDDEAVPQKKKVKILSYLSRDIKGKSTHTRNPSLNEMQCTNPKLGITKVEK